MTSLSDLFAALFPQPSPELLGRLAALDAAPAGIARVDGDLTNLEELVADLASHVDSIAATVARLDARLNPPPVPPPTPVGPSGFPMPTTDPAGMTTVFADDFSAYPNVPVGVFSAATKGRWGSYPNDYIDTSKNGHYNTAKTCSIVNGVLDIHLWSEMVNGVQVNYSSAPYPLIPGNQPKGVINGVDFGTGGPVRGSLYYGEIEYAFRCAKVGVGRKTAWLLWPDKGTNTKDAFGNPGGYGEIDFVEGPLTGTINGYHHRDGATIGGDQDVRSTGARFDSLEWHIAKIKWAPNLCEFYFDGNKLGASITNRVDKMPMHFLFQSECYPLSGGPPPPLDSDAHLQIDWIVMRQLDGVYP